MHGTGVSTGPKLIMPWSYNQNSEEPIKHFIGISQSSVMAVEPNNNNKKTYAWILLVYIFSFYFFIIHFYYVIKVVVHTYWKNIFKKTGPSLQMVWEALIWVMCFFLIYATVVWQLRLLKISSQYSRQKKLPIQHYSFTTWLIY